jgi:predicted nucleic acid-binding protein
VAGYFVDSSALVKRYVHETGSVWLSGLVASAAGNDIYIARITTVEVVAALTRRARGGTITAADARAACLLFRNDILLYFPVKQTVFTQLRACHSVLRLPSAVYGGQAPLSASA